MNCKEIQENLSLYLDKSLTMEELNTVNKHLAGCPDCQKELEALEKTIALLSSLEELQPPASFRRSLRHKLEEQAERKRRSRWSAFIPDFSRVMHRSTLLPIAAALVLMIIVIPLVADNVRPGIPLSKTAQNTANNMASGAAPSMPAPQPADTDGKGYTNDSLSQQEAARSGDGAIASGAKTKSTEQMTAADITFTDQSVKESAPAETKIQMKATAASAATGTATVAATPTVQDRTPTVEQKIIKNADITLQVDQYAQAVDSVKNNVASLGGYVTNESVNTAGADGMVNGRMQVRIPSEKFDSFLTGIEELGKLKNRNVYSQDVTEEYVDVESNLKAMRTKEERLLSILSKSGQLSDVLAVENELANTRAQLESLEGRLRYLNNRTAFSTVSLNIQQAAAPTKQISASGLAGVLLRTKEAFFQAINNILADFGKVTVFFGSALPYLVIAALVIWLVWWFARKKSA